MGRADLDGWQSSSRSPKFVGAGFVGSAVWTVNVARPLKRTGPYSLRSPSPNGLGPQDCFDGRSRDGAAVVAIYFPAAETGSLHRGELTDEDALRAARPHVAVKLWHAPHLVFVCKIRRGAKPNAGLRADVGGRVMTIWELWARSVRGDREVTPRSVKQTKALFTTQARGLDGRSEDPRAYVFFKRGNRICFPFAAFGMYVALRGSRSRGNLVSSNLN
jgi:hypothetical protein